MGKRHGGARQVVASLLVALAVILMHGAVAHAGPMMHGGSMSHAMTNTDLDTTDHGSPQEGDPRPSIPPSAHVNACNVVILADSGAAPAPTLAQCSPVAVEQGVPASHRSAPEPPVPRPARNG